MTDQANASINPGNLKLLSAEAETGRMLSLLFWNQGISDCVALFCEEKIHTAYEEQEEKDLGYDLEGYGLLRS